MRRREQWRALFNKQFKEGLRASLKTASLLTGGQVIDLNFYPDAPVISRSRWRAIRSSRPPRPLDRIEHQVNLILDKFVDMDMATTLTQVNSTLMTLDKTLKHVSAVVRIWSSLPVSSRPSGCRPPSTRASSSCRRRCRPMMPVPRPIRSCVSPGAIPQPADEQSCNLWSIH